MKPWGSVRWRHCSKPSIFDILVNRYDKVFIERGGKLSETTVRFKDDAHLLHIIEKIVSLGRRIDEAQPIVDVRLQDGSRVNALFHRWRWTVPA